MTDEAGHRMRPTAGPFATRADALAGLARMLADIDRGAYVAPDRMAFGNYLTAWLDARRMQLRPTTTAGYEGVIDRYLVPAIGQVPLHRLRPAHFDRVYAEMTARGLSAASVRQAHAVARKALADAVRKGVLGANPTDAADPPTVRRPALATWTADDLRAFLETTDDTWGPLFTLAAMTGMRRGELLGLRWGDVDFATGALTVRRTVTAPRSGVLVIGEPKTARSRRSIDLDAATLDVLRPLRGLPDRHVFGSEAGPWHPDSVSTAFARAVSMTDLPPIRFHDLRHIHATLLLKAGVPPHVVSRRLGHASVAFTLDTYAHVLPGQDRAAVDALAQSVRAAVSTATAKPSP